MKEVIDSFCCGLVIGRAPLQFWALAYERKLDKGCSPDGCGSVPEAATGNRGTEEVWMRYN